MTVLLMAACLVMAGLVAIGAMTPFGAPDDPRLLRGSFWLRALMLLECLVITLVFALTCGAVLMFMRVCPPTAPKQPGRPQSRPDHP
jgi:hypothetical protein